MTESYRCPQCGAEVPQDAPQGLCPNCVLKAGLGTQQTDSVSQTGSAPTDPFLAQSQYTPPTPAELAPYFPDLEILELIGRGGMGVVYKARQKRLDRLVALKILAPRGSQDEAFAKRFAREARAMAMLSHPHIVAVYDFGQTAAAGNAQPSTIDESSPLASGENQSEGGVSSSPAPQPSSPFYYFVMEYIDGLNLRRLMDAGKLHPEEALAIVPQICDALQYAHNHGVVHRDIKPENVLLDKEGHVKIADFGIAKLVGEESKDVTLTGTGQIMGTPQYMAPEQIEHPLQVDHRADIYSLGVVFYQMLTGELPIGRFAPPSKKVQIDVRLDAVVLRALEKEPELRYQQASEIKTRVENIVTTQPPIACTVDSTSARPSVASDWRSWVMGVGVRAGSKVANWRGLILQWLSAIGLCCLLIPGRDIELNLWTLAMFALASALAVAAFAWVQFQRPIEKLPILDLRPSQQHSPNDSNAAGIPAATSTANDAAVEQARRQVHGPALGLLIVGILNWVVLTLFSVFLWYILSRHGDSPSPIHYIVIPAAFAVGIVLILGAFKMKQLEAYGLAVVASILAIIISPSNLIGLPIGIWALVVLSQRDVRAAFASNHQSASSMSTVSSVAKDATGTPTGMVALVLCLAAIPVVLFIGGVGGLSAAYVFSLFVLLGIITLILGIANWVSGLGKTAVIVSIIFLSVSLWGLVVSSLSKIDTVTGSGIVKTESREATGFSSVLLKSFGKVTIRQTGKESLMVRAEDNILPLLKSYVVGQTLYFDTTSDISIHPTKPVEFIVETKRLNGIKVSGTGKVDAEGIQSDTFSASLSGAGTITVAGIADTLHLKLSGVGNYRGERLQTKRAIAKISGVGNAVVHATDELDATVSGMGAIQYIGSPRVRSHVLGNGKVIPQHSVKEVAGDKWYDETEESSRDLPENEQSRTSSPATDLKLLLGPWKVVWIEKGDASSSNWSGEWGNVDFDQLTRMVFDERYFHFQAVKQGNVCTLVWQVNPLAVPKTIDLRAQPSPTEPGALAALGIYEINGDRLKMCLAKYSPVLQTEQRPHSIAIRPNSGDILLTLERYRPSEDEKSLQGKWNVVSQFEDGKAVSQKELKHRDLDVFDVEAFFRDGSNPTFPRDIAGGLFVLDSTKQPKTITISGFYYDWMGFPQRNKDGNWKKQQLVGIYELDGSRLTIAYRKDSARPKKFESTPGSGVTLLVLRKIELPKAMKDTGTGGMDDVTTLPPPSNTSQNGAITPANHPRVKIFGPVKWKEITTQDCDAQGLVFFNMETGKSLKPPFALKLTNHAPDIVEFTPKLKEWIKANDMDMLFHLGHKSWDKMRLEMQEDFIGQQNEWETLTPEKVRDHFAKKDAAGFVRCYLPGTSSSMDYHGDWSSCQAFRTRANAIGVLQDEGFENTSVHGVRIRYKLVQDSSTTSPSAANEAKSPFQVRLASGVTVDLLVGEDKKDGAWWNPDGTPTTPPTRDHLYGHVGDVKAGYMGRVFVAKPGNVPAEPLTGGNWRFDPVISGIGSDNGWLFNSPVFYSRRTKIPLTMQTVTVRFAIASGPWRTRTESPAESHSGVTTIGQKEEVVFSDAYEKNGGVTVMVAHNISGPEVRVVAVGYDGQEHRSSEHWSVGDKDLAKLTASFAKLSLKDVKAFRLQTRLYQWVEFRNVSLQPGKKTDVQVVLDNAPSKTGSDIARLQLESAERQLELVRAQYEKGVVAVDKLYEAELARDLAAAETKGDVVAAARAKLRYAERMLTWIEQQFNAGYRVTPLDREKAKLARDVARTELKDAEQKAKASNTAESPAAMDALATIRPLDVLQVRVVGAILDQPIDGFYLVEPSGDVALGPSYGRANVQGLTMEQAEAAIAKQLRKTLTRVGVQATLARRSTTWRRAVFTRSPYAIEPMDVLRVHVAGTILDVPIDGVFLVEAGGTIALGPAYGRANVKGLSLEAAETAIKKQLERILNHPEVQVTLPTILQGKLPGGQWQAVTPPADPYKLEAGDLLFIDAIGVLPELPIHDLYLVEPTGTVALGTAYGRIVVKGLTLKDARKAIQKKLREVVSKPAVSVTLAGWVDDTQTMLPGTRISSHPSTREFLHQENNGRRTAAAIYHDHKFGPVIERLLKDPSVDRASGFIDLDSGKIIPLPSTIAFSDRKAVWEWAKRKGVDAVASTAQEIRGLLGFELVVAQLADDDWNTATKATLQRAIGKETFKKSKRSVDDSLAQSVITVNTVSTNPNISHTYAFETREGALGILQVLDYNDEPGGSIKIRYKLVQPAADGTSAVPSTAGPGHTTCISIREQPIQPNPRLPTKFAKAT